MKKMICWLVIVCFVTACTTTKTKTTTKLDKKSVSYSCLEPELILENGKIKGQFYEFFTGREVEINEECVTYHSFFGAMTNGYNAKYNTLKYLFLTVMSMGLLIPYDLVLTMFQLDFKTLCDKQELKTVRTVDEKRPAEGTFDGKIMVVKLDEPDWYRENIFHKDNLSSLEVQVGQSYTDYAVELKGDYKSNKVECSIDKQTIVKSWR